jgi:hypothetical protein
MGLFNRLGSFVAHGVRKLGHFGGEALNKLGILKSSYGNINNAFGGVLGKTLEALPLIGPVLGSIGKFLDNKESMKTLANTFKRADVYGEAIEHGVNKLSRLKGS